MTNLAQRTITGFIGAAIMISAILWNKYSFAGLFLFISIMSLTEFYSLAEKAGIKANRYLGIAGGAFLYFIISAFYVPLDFPTIIYSIIGRSLLPILFLIFIFELYKTSPQPFTNIAYSLLGIIYFPFTLALLSAIAVRGELFGKFHPGIIAGYLFILWANDSGAYFVGRKFGKRKLFERISPNKTWEGSVGGAFLAFIVANVVLRYVTDLSPLDWHVVTAIIIVFGTFGDLVKSLFKRSIHIKDSGTILPGHGGFLDRFDGLFISSPFVFTYLMIVYH